MSHEDGTSNPALYGCRRRMLIWQVARWTLATSCPRLRANPSRFRFYEWEEGAASRSPLHPAASSGSCEGMTQLDIKGDAHAKVAIACQGALDVVRAAVRPAWMRDPELVRACGS